MLCDVPTFLSLPFKRSSDSDKPLYIVGKGNAFELIDVLIINYSLCDTETQLVNAIFREIISIVL